jgi:hypothetical protein
LADALLELALIALPPSVLVLARYFSWGAGPIRCTLCLALAAGVWLATRRRGYLSSPWDVGRRGLVLAALSGGLLALHAQRFVADIQHGGECLTDMGRPSICAGEWLRHGLNPWAECVPKLTAAERKALVPGSTWSECVHYDRCLDRKAGGSYEHWTHHGPGFDFMDGYKYGPLSALVYAPVVHPWREQGLFALNFACWIAQVVLMLLLARAAFPAQPAAAWRGMLSYLLPLVLPLARWLPSLHVETFWGSFELAPPEQDTFVLELTRRCSNDIIPVVLSLAAVWLAARARSAAAGCILGLSLAAKPLPGLLVWLFLPGVTGVNARRLHLATIATATLCYLPVFIWSPRELIANLLLFSFLRPTNGSSIRPYLPPFLESCVSFLQLASVAWIAVRFYRQPAQRDLAGFLRASALATILFVALNKVVHGNYLLWIQPLIALALAGLPFRGHAQPPRP